MRPKGNEPLTVTTAHMSAIVTMRSRQMENDDTSMLESLGSTDAV